MYGNASFSSNDHYFSSRRQFYIKNFFHVCSGIEDSVLVHGIHKWENLKLHLQQKRKNSFCCGKKLDTFCKKMCQKHCTCLTCLHHSHFLSFQTNLFRFLHRGGAGRGRASLLRQVISVFHQNLSQLHISVVGGGVSSPIIRAVIQHLDIWSCWWMFDF